MGPVNRYILSESKDARFKKKPTKNGGKYCLETQIVICYLKIVILLMAILNVALIF